MKNKEILIVGTGGIGAYFGGRLSQADANVATVCRSDYDVVKTDGFNIKSKDGDFIFKPDEVLKSAKEYSKEADFLIVSLKVLPEIDTINLIKDAITKNTTIVLIQNGINIEENIYNKFPDNEIISAIAYIGVAKTAAGEIDHQDYGRLTVGKYPKGNSKKAIEFSNLFLDAPVECNVVDNIQYYRWLKLVWNIPYNPVSVLGFHADTKTIMANKNSAELIRNLMIEVANIAEKAGYKLEDDVVQKNIDFTLAMTPYKTSMLIDYENNRPMEVEAILGNTVEIADELSVEIPHIKTIYALLQLTNR